MAHAIKRIDAPVEVREITNEDYHAERDHDSSSTLRIFERSPAEYYERRVSGRLRGTTTDPQRLGTIAHLAILEPELFDVTVVVPPAKVCASNGAWSGGAFKEFRAAADAEGKVLAKSEELDAARWQSDNCRANPAIRQFLERTTFREYSIFWRDGLHQLKARIDAGDEIACEIADLKTVADLDEFSRSVSRYGYHKQAALYVRAYEALYGSRPTFSYILVGSTPPYDCCLRVMPPEAITLGERCNADTLSRLQDCRDGVRPWVRDGYHEVRQLDLPPWLLAGNDEPQTTGQSHEF